MVDGVQVASNQTSAVNDSLDSSNYIKDQVISVEVIADDGSATDCRTARLPASTPLRVRSTTHWTVEPAAGADGLVC